MRIKKLLASAAAVAMIVLGGNVVAASPAAAADGFWRPYPTGTNPVRDSSDTWRCGATASVATDVFAQACVVRSTADIRKVRAAVIVQNRRNTQFNAYASVFMHAWSGDARLGDWQCGLSGVARSSFSVCFGAERTDLNNVYAKSGTANTTFLYGSSYV